MSNNTSSILEGAQASEHRCLQTKVSTPDAAPQEGHPFLCHPACPGVPWEQSTCLRQVEGEMTRQRSPWMQGPEGRPPNVSPARKGWEIDPEQDPSAVGAALNRSSALPVSLGAKPTCPGAPWRNLQVPRTHPGNVEPRPPRFCHLACPGVPWDRSVA
jgi:hypothetical protein